MFQHLCHCRQYCDSYVLMFLCPEYYLVSIEGTDRKMNICPEYYLVSIEGTDRKMNICPEYYLVSIEGRQKDEHMS